MIIHGSGTIESFIDVSGLNASLSSNVTVTAQIWVTHTWNGDLTIRLYGPDGSYITLSNQRGFLYDNVFNGTLFTDSASNSVSSYSFSNNIVASPLKPEQPFSNFIGKNTNGKWKLLISTTYDYYDRQLYGFILNIKGKTTKIKKSKNKYKK